MINSFYRASSVRFNTLGLLWRLRIGMGPIWSVKVSVTMHSNETLPLPLDAWCVYTLRQKHTQISNFNLFCRVHISKQMINRDIMDSWIIFSLYLNEIFNNKRQIASSEFHNLSTGVQWCSVQSILCSSKNFWSKKSLRQVSEILDPPLHSSSLSSHYHP